MNHHSNTHIDIPLSEKVKSLPGFFGIHLEEQAPYDVLKVEAGIEIRSYRPQTQIRVTIKGDFKEAQKEAFSTLAAYIFGENEQNEKIQMITPVLLEEIDKEKKWAMSFILPSNLSASSCPQPKDNRISIHERPAHMIASIRYAGINTEEKIYEHNLILKKWLKKNPWYISLSDFQTAQFDGPLTIPFFRKNEIHVEVKNIH